MNEKWFAFHWLDNKVEYGKGTSASDAFRNLGYFGGAISALDFYEEDIKEVPLEYKEVSIVDIKNNPPTILNTKTMFTVKAIEKIKECGTDIGTIDIDIANHNWKYNFSILPFEIKLIELF